MVSLHFIATYDLTGISLMLSLFARATYDRTGISLMLSLHVHSHLRPDRNVSKCFPFLLEPLTASQESQ